MGLNRWKPHPLGWGEAISEIPAFQLAGLRMIFAAVGISLFLPRHIEELRETTLREVAILSGAAFLGLIMGQYLFVLSVSMVGSPIAAPVSAINPIIASFLAVLILKEKPSKRIVEGLILAVAGILLISTG
jgi:DME family drug/metabolite transporter